MCGEVIVLIIDRPLISLVQSEKIKIQKFSHSVYSAALPYRILDFMEILKIKE